MDQEGIQPRSLVGAPSQPPTPFPSEVDEKCVIFINCTFINFHRPNERKEEGRGGGGVREAVGTKSGYTHARHVG